MVQYHIIPYRLHHAPKRGAEELGAFKGLWLS